MLRARLRRRRAKRTKRANAHGKATAGMRLTFRAELMPGRDSAERTFTVSRVLANGRIELAGLRGQHTATEFESFD